jgi:ankyrin repeat protein
MRNVNGQTPLHRASFLGQPRIVEAILAKPSAKVSIGGVPYLDLMNRAGKSALANTFDGDNVELVNLLLRAGARPASLKFTRFTKAFAPIMDRSCINNTKSNGLLIFRLLAQNGLDWDAVDSEQNSLLMVVCAAEALDYCHLILKNLSTQRKLELALAHEDRRGWTVLLNSVSGPAKICRVLLQYGAAAGMPHAPEVARNRMTPLENACRSGCLGAVQMMLGFSDKLGDLSYALYWAAERGSLETCQAILDRDTNVDRRINDRTARNYDANYQVRGPTILRKAAYEGNAFVVELLLKHGFRAWPEQVTKSGAERRIGYRYSGNSHEKIMDFLDSHGIFKETSQ